MGEAAALVQQALQADPDHLQALALAGGIALESGRPQEARRLWQRVLDQVPPGTDLARNIQASMDKASAARP
ncbi:tetratricopeptide repeat protein [Pelomonas sp. APW6]|uniref:Tetratricopeptide repeat protein n=1 Tax=Roseateles subflavus TaxID=3053353 RepID=A0ABT7LFV6_9BURK|nr:tetratricopeptide repeat protein [Pelomonas sp. APW6]MDL5031738.1 tetratricopeptide repeat protein [Pelomonas sp. APW6]